MSEVSGSDNRHGREDDGSVGLAAAGRAGSGDRDAGEHHGGKSGDEAGGSDASPSRIDTQDDRDGADKGGDNEHMHDKREVPEGKPEKRLQPAGVVEVDHGGFPEGRLEGAAMLACRTALRRCAGAGG